MIKYLAIPAIMFASLSTYANDVTDAANTAEAAAQVAGNVAECVDEKDVAGNACQAVADTAMGQIDGAGEAMDAVKTTTDAMDAVKTTTDAVDQVKDAATQ